MPHMHGLARGTGARGAAHAGGACSPRIHSSACPALQHSRSRRLTTSWLSGSPTLGTFRVDRSRTETCNHGALNMNRELESLRYLRWHGHGRRSQPSVAHDAGFYCRPRQMTPGSPTDLAQQPRNAVPSGRECPGGQAASRVAHRLAKALAGSPQCCAGAACLA